MALVGAGWHAKLAIATIATGMSVTDARRPGRRRRRATEGNRADNRCRGPLVRVLGMISGTSNDSIDVAVVDFALDGDMLAGRIEYVACVPYPPALRSRLIKALPPARPGFGTACELDTSIGHARRTAASWA
jgi:hypothetical protein